MTSMDKQTTLFLLLAAALGLGASRADLLFDIAKNLSPCIERLGRPRTLKEAMERVDKAPTGSSQRTYSPPGLEAPSYIVEKIEHVECIYASQRARDNLHNSLEIILKDFPYSDNIHERCERIQYLENTFFSSYFGLTDPERIGGVLLPGKPVMDEERSRRILEHAQTYHGGAKRYPDDPCLLYFGGQGTIPDCRLSQPDYLLQDESRREPMKRIRLRSSRPTWNDAAQFWLGAKPSSEYRPLTPSQRAIGTYSGGY